MSQRIVHCLHAAIKLPNVCWQEDSQLTFLSTNKFRPPGERPTVFVCIEVDLIHTALHVAEPHSARARDARQWVGEPPGFLFSNFHDD